MLSPGASVVCYQIMILYDLKLWTKSGFQSALSGRMTIAQQFTAGITEQENAVREADG